MLINIVKFKTKFYIANKNWFKKTIYNTNFLLLYLNTFSKNL